MRKKIYLILSLILILNIISFIEYEYVKTHKPITHNTITEDTPKLSLEHFLNHLGHLESGNKYDKINTYGYLGKYQFGRSALTTLGYDDITDDEFINSPQLQEKVMIQNLKFNKKVLQDHIDKYVGKCVNNVMITESGLLAGAHLAGARNVKRFLDGGNDVSDSYGTKLSYYLIVFSNYKFNLK
jgi:hypothetical protein